MADWDVVRRIAMALPGVEEHASTGHNAGLGWRVRNRLLAWERPLGVKDRRDLESEGRAAPPEPYLGVRTPGLEAKEAVLAEEPTAVFTIPHFDGYAAVLVSLPLADEALLTELLTESWTSLAAARVVAAWRASQAD